MPRHQNQVAFTAEGLKELAEIVKAARQGTPYEKWQLIVGVSHATLWNIERLKIKAISINTLMLLAPQTPYCLDELISICNGISPAEVEQARLEKAESPLNSAEEIWTLAKQMSTDEILKLIRIAIERSQLSTTQVKKLLQSLVDKLT